VHQPHRQLLRQPAADQHGGHVGQHHAGRRAGDDADEFGREAGRQRDGRDLRLVAHLGEEEGDQRRHEDAVAGLGLLVRVELVRDQHPARHREEGQAQRPAQRRRADESGQPAAQRAGGGMVEHGRGEDAPDDGPGPLEAGREHEGEELGLVADLGEGHQAGGNQESLHGRNWTRASMAAFYAAGFG
jgi:hypothetical protein